MSSRSPATASLSFEEFAKHGDPHGANRDGWGIAYYQDRGVRLMKEDAPAADSDLVRFIETHQYTSTLVASHIRHASQGSVSYDNTQPFERELGGVVHLFCHNGNLSDVRKRMGTRLGRFLPIGQTDSELAFCVLLAAMERLWREAGGVPSLARRTEIVRSHASLFAELGPANFLYADGDALFVHGHWRPRPGSEGVVLPGLHLLEHRLGEAQERFEAPGIRLHRPGEEQDVLMVASVPLSTDAWEPLGRGELLVIKAGRVHERLLLRNPASSAERLS